MTVYLSCDADCHVSSEEYSAPVLVVEYGSLVLYFMSKRIKQRYDITQSKQLPL